MTSNPKIPWKLVPGLVAGLRADGVLLHATDGFVERAVLEARAQDSIKAVKP